MNVKEAAAAARNYITSENPGLVNVPLDLEEAVPDPARREWRVTLSFTRPGGQQGQQSVSTSRSYKEIIINDTDGSVISMPNRTPCAPKSCKISCTAGQCAQPGCAAPAHMSWRDTWRTWCKIIFVYPTAAVGWTGLIMLYIEIGLGNPSSREFWLPLLAGAVGTFIGLFAEGLWWQRGGRRCSRNKRKKRRPR